MEELGEVFLDKDYLLEHYKELEFVEIEEELQCKRCQRALINNYKANCGHYFCLNCKNVFSNGTGWKCPACQTGITHVDTNNVEIETRVFNLRVRCLNRKYGCGEITLLKDLMSHRNMCENTKDVNLPAMFRGSHCISTIMDKLGGIASKIKELNDEVLTYKTNTEERFEAEARNLDHFDEKFSNLDHKVNGLSSQLTENKSAYKLTTNWKVKSQLKDLANEQQKILNELNKLTKQHIEIESKISSLEGTKNKPINILLMGESGSGKSTLINAFANYCKHNTFEESKLSQEKSLINTKIVITSEDYEERFITTGTHDLNECMERDQSSTIACRSYLFPVAKDYRIRFIDTPGFASTYGVRADESGVEDVANYLSQYEELQAVAIVMTNSESRATLRFEYCLQQILSFLHKSSAPNLIFIFTKTTKVADSLQTIRKALSNIEAKASAELGFKISKQNVFCFENEGFNISIAIRNGIGMEEDYVMSGIQHWGMAKAEFERLITHVMRLEPFDVSETLKLNEVRSFINDVCDVLNHLNNSVQCKQNEDSKKLEVEKLHFEKLKMEEAVRNAFRFVYGNAVLVCNFAKEKYVDFVNKTPDIAAVARPLQVQIAVDLISTATKTFVYNSYSDIEKLKKDLVLMDVYSGKLATIFQLNNHKNKPVKKEKIV